MKCLIWLILTFGFIIHPKFNAVPLVVDDEILTPIINDQFADGTKAETIKLVQEGETTYLVREGFDDKKNCRGSVKVRSKPAFQPPEARVIAALARFHSGKRDNWPSNGLNSRVTGSILGLNLGMDRWANRKKGLCVT